MSDMRILMIDDEEVVRLCGERTLRGMGYVTDVVGSGAEGLALVRERSYALVITDLKMPDMDGLQVIESIRQIRPGTAVIVVTGYSEVATIDAAIEAGALTCVEKPFTPEDLLTAVKNAIGWPSSK